MYTEIVYVMHTSQSILKQPHLELLIILGEILNYSTGLCLELYHIV